MLANHGSSGSWRMIALASCMAIILQSCSSPEFVASGLEERAAADLRQGKIEQSLQGFQAALDADSESVLAMIGIANCHAKNGDSVQFELAAITAAGAAPRSIESWARIGTMYIQGAERFRRTPRARIYAEIGVGYLRTVFGSEPNRPGLIESLGVGLLLKDDAPTAAVFLGEAYRRQPKRLDFAHAYLLALRKSDNKVEATRVLKKLEADGRVLPSAWKELQAWSQSALAPDPLIRP